MNPLRLAILVKHFVTTGGVEKFAVELTTRLRDRGHHIDLYSWEADPEAARGMRHIEVPRRCRFSSILTLIAYGRDAQRLRAGRVYDVVHSHERAFGHDILSFHGIPYQAGLQQYSLLRRLDQTYLSPRNQLQLWLDRQQMSTPVIAPVSGVVRDALLRCYQPTGRLQVIPPGVDIDRFHPDHLAPMRLPAREKLGIHDHEVVYLFVGSEFKRKGLDDLIPALPANARLIVVGRGQKMDHYLALGRQCGATDRIHYTGLIKDVLPYYAAADVLTLPSRSEAFGMAVLEGMACALPAVTTATTGAACLIQDQKNGICTRTPEELKQGLHRLLDPGLRTRMGAAARQTAEAYTWDRVADSYEALYAEFAAQKNRATADSPRPGIE